LDHIGFDHLSRRIAVKGIAGGAILALLGGHETDAKKRSRAKRCRKKKRTFCAGRCCPKGHGCENRICIAACGGARDCDGAPGQLCGSSADECLCLKTAAGRSACLSLAGFGPTCADFAACSAADPCPPGLICGICGCPAAGPDFRCFRPCLPG